jgi:hypothetical protein
LARRFAKDSGRGFVAGPAPRYDDVFFKGTAALDALAGDTPAASSGELVMDESIWTSEQRREPGIP